MIEHSYEHPTRHRWEANANTTLWGQGGAIGRAERTRTARQVYSARSGAPGDEMLISVVDTFGEAEAAFERYIEQQAR